MLRYNYVGSALLDFLYNFMRSRGVILLMMVLKMTDIISSIDGGNTGGCALWVRCGYFVLNEQPLIHFFKTLHVPWDIVLDILDTTDLKDHELVDSIPHIPLPFGLDI